MIFILLFCILNYNFKMLSKCMVSEIFNREGPTVFCIIYFVVYILSFLPKVGRNPSEADSFKPPDLIQDIS